MLLKNVSPRMLEFESARNGDAEQNNSHPCCRRASVDGALSILDLHSKLQTTEIDFKTICNSHRRHALSGNPHLITLYVECEQEICSAKKDDKM